MKKFFIKLLIFSILFFMVGCDKVKVVLVEDLHVEINEKVTINQLVVEVKKGELTNGDQVVDTSSLGEKQETVKYLDSNNKEGSLEITIIVVDTTAPVIEGPDEIIAYEGTAIDLLKNVIVTDNSGENITATVEGSYDFNTKGDYLLTWTAKDSSGNTAEKEFYLRVKNANDIYLGRYNAGGKYGQYSWIELLPEGQYKSTYNFCQGTFDITGTYTIKGNVLTLKLVNISDGYAYKTVTFKINGNKLTFTGADKSSAFYYEKCYDCSRSKTYTKQEPQ